MALPAGFAPTAPIVSAPTTPVGFAPTAPIVDKNTATAQKTTSFFSSNEPTPLLFNEDGQAVGIITSDLQRSVGSPANKDGLDIYAPNGTPIKLPISGTIVKIVDEYDHIGVENELALKHNGGFGNQIVVRNEETGEEWQISHIKKDSIKDLGLKEGQKVSQFEEIGQVGNTGFVSGNTGNHVDIEKINEDGSKESDINKIKADLESGLGQEVLDKFEAGQLDNMNAFLPAIRDLNDNLAQELTPSTIEILGNTFKSQWETIKTLPGMALDIAKAAPGAIAGEVVEAAKIGGKFMIPGIGPGLALKETIDQFTGEDVSPVKNIYKSLAKDLYGRGAAVARSSRDLIASTPEVLTLISELKEEAKRQNKSTFSLVLDAFENKDLDKIQLSDEAKKALAEVDQSSLDQMQALAGIAELMPMPLAQVAAGVGEGVATALEEGKTAKEGFVSGLVVGGEKAVLVGILNKLFANKTPKEIKDLQKAGVDEADITALARETGLSESESKKLLDAAVDSAADRTKPSALDIIGDDLGTAQQSIKNQIDDVGKEIGAISKSLKEAGEVDITGIKQAMAQKLDDLNVQIGDDGVLNFDVSDIGGSGLSGDRKLLNDLWKRLNKSDTMPARDALALTRSLGNQITVGSKTGALSASKAAATEFRRQLRDSLNQISDLAGPSKKYFDLLNVDEALTRKITESGVAAPNFLKKTFGTAKDVPRELLQQIDDISRRYNIPEGQNLLQKTDFAIATERVAGTPTAKKSLSEAVASGITAAPGKKGIVTRLIEGASKKVLPTPMSPAEAAAALIKKGPISRAAPTVQAPLSFLSKTAKLTGAQAPKTPSGAITGFLGNQIKKQQEPAPAPLTKRAAEIAQPRQPKAQTLSPFLKNILKFSQR